MSDQSLNEVVQSIKRSRKYADLCEETIRRVAGRALARHPSPKSATKAAKRKLHQVYGAYVERLDMKRVEGLVESIAPDAGAEEVRGVCRSIMECHASTAERLAFVGELYEELLGRTGQPSAVLDIGCGLNPFALPWMDLPVKSGYYAIDIDGRLTACINGFLGRLGRAQTAQCTDVLVSPPDVEADVALLLKTLPCLEQQEKGASAMLLRALNARHAIVSFPTRSLGGAEKGMREHYGAVMCNLADELGAPVERLDYPTETFYVLDLT